MIKLYFPDEISHDVVRSPICQFMYAVRITMRCLQWSETALFTSVIFLHTNEFSVAGLVFHLMNAKMGKIWRRHKLHRT